MKINTTYSTFSPTPLTLGSLGIDMKERYKVDFFFFYDEQEMKDQINSESILV